MSQKRFDDWDNQFDAKVFPEISEDKFRITDKALLQELNEMMYQPEKKNTNAVQGSEKFTEKSRNLLSALDSVKSETPSVITNQWIHYSLEDVEIDDSKTISSAFDFLEQLKKRHEPQEIGPAEVIDTEFKPTFHVRDDKVRVERLRKNKSEIERSKLSFGDDL